jgi:secreted trypsin-like serine protease
MTIPALVARLAAAAVASCLLLVGGAASATAAPSPSSDTDPMPYVVGGDPADPERYAGFMASLQVVNPETNEWMHVCAASVISPWQVLTAAHCAPDLSAGQAWRIVVGASVLPAGAPGERVQIRGLSASVSHPDFGWEGYDAAVLRLQSPLIDVQPVSLPTPGTDALLAPGSIATLIGWGATDSDDEDGSPILREVGLPILSSGECALAGGAVFNPDSDMCAGKTGHSACYGDSGGPLFRTIGTTVYQIGIVSRGSITGCGQTGNPTIFTYTGSEAIRSGLDF